MPSDSPDLTAATGPATPAGPVRLMLVDDHPLVRDGLRARLSSVAGLQVVAEAADASEALVAAQQSRPDLVLMDVGLRGVNGIQATRQLLQAWPGLRVVMLSMQDAPATVREAMLAGARAYLLKDSPAEDIIQAIRAVMAGQVLPPLTLLAHAPGLSLANGAAEPPGPQSPSGHVSLTPRERDVLRLIAQGLSSKAIGQRLDMGVRTVETHRTHLRRKLNLDSPAALVRYAIAYTGM